MLKILPYGYINRNDDNVLIEAKIKVLDKPNKKTYEVFIDVYREESYRITVWGDDVVDGCIMSRGVILEKIPCGNEIIELVTKYLL